MASKTSTKRVSREVGSELLIQGALRLLTEMPPAKVTVRDIASEAGLQTMHLKRYFGSRNELLVAVSNRLMGEIVDALAEMPLENVFLWLQKSEYVNLRLRIVTHLLDEGVDPREFADDQVIYSRIAERISTVNNVGKRTAQTYAHIIQLVLQGHRLMGSVNGLNPREQRDVFQVLAAISSHLQSVETTLSWPTR